MLPFLYRVCIFTALFAAVSLAQTIEDEFNNPCSTVTNCGECIQTSKLCAWCGAETFPRDYSRCDLLDNVKRNCKESDIFNPKSVFAIGEDADWTSGNRNSSPVQVKPQSIQFNVRPNYPMDFKLSFRQQANYPVDLYFLLDLSFGMVRQEEAQQRLIALGEEISKSMNTITNNFKLGFGTFVDKVLMPYTAWTEQMLQNRCPFDEKKRKCSPPHDYRNQVNLGDNNEEFAKKMKKALEDVSQSMDDVEGGLDGLIQALDCERIGWREVSRRIIVYSSNSLFHLAGSGKLGGATKQSNLQCDLTADGEYAGEKIYDYPSVSQIADKLRQKNANVIFAVMSNVTRHYELLENFLEGAVVGKLEENSKNIVQLIKDKYYELRSKIQFKASNADNVKITLKSKCLGNVVTETDKCENLGIMDSVEFDVRFTVSKDICEGTDEPFVNKTVLINAVGLNEQLVMNLMVQCKCECETKQAEKPNSDKCDKNGTLECGICSCNEGRYGRQCECDETNVSSEESLEKCRRKKNESTICSGNGECICGTCHCFPIPNYPKKIYDGDFCECNNYNCPYGKNKKQCADQGECKCGKCHCTEDWLPPTCECSSKNDTCYASNGKLCNGVGHCECGRCICRKDSQMYGPTCESCVFEGCPLECSRHRDCAECKGYQTGSYDLDECEEKCKTTVVDDSLPKGAGIKECNGTDVKGCMFFFSYQYTPKVLITAQRTKKCPESANTEAIIGGTVAAVVVIPLFIICLIIFIRNRRDAKEYADFMREREKAHWDATSNPIYKDPKSTFQNPTYKGGKK